MKIAVASEGSNVSQHFGHCRNFNIFDVENGRITDSMSIDNGDHAHGCVPDFLTSSGVQLIITGGIGGGAVANLINKDIDVITGVSGSAQAAVESFLSGTLATSGSLCSGHQHGHGGHHCGHHGGHGHDHSHGCGHHH